MSGRPTTAAYSLGFGGVNAATPPNTKASTAPAHTLFDNPHKGKKAISATAIQRIQFGLRELLLSIQTTLRGGDEDPMSTDASTAAGLKTKENTMSNLDAPLERAKTARECLAE